MAAGKTVPGSKHPAAWSRLLRRIFRPFLTDAEKERIAAAIAEAERQTTGQIHVHVIGRLGQRDAMEAAKALFHKLGLEKTANRNGVLILISHLDHRFAIYGDSGIHDKSGQHLWDRAANVLKADFAVRRYPEGIEACVREVGTELALHFPKKGA